MRFLTAEEAAAYANFAVIFGTINGGVSYLDPWNPASTEIVVDDRDYYYFNGSSSSSGTSHTFDTTTTIAKGGTLEWDGLFISAENGNVAWNQNANALNMKAGAFIKFSVKAGTTVTVETYPNYNYFTLNGVGTGSANMLSQYYAEDTEVILLSTGDLYIYSIIINPGEEAPTAPTLNEIKATGLNTNYKVGEELNLADVVVKGYFSDNSVTAVEATVDATAVNNAAAGSYDVVFTYGGKSFTVTVTYEDPNADPDITKNAVLDFTTPAGLEEVQNNPRVTMTGSIRHNGGEIQIQGTISFGVKAGTIITVIPYANTQYASYTIGVEGATDLETKNETYSFVADKDCTVVYTGLSNNYLQKIVIECPILENLEVSFGSDGNYKDSGIDFSDASIRDNGGDNSQISSGSFSFIVQAGAIVTINGYPNYTSYSLNGSEEITAQQYVYVAEGNERITIAAVNGNNYFYSFSIVYPVCFAEDTVVNFGSAGNYKDSGIDFSGIQIGDNGGNNSQIKNGSFSFRVKAGATVTINGYPGYTSYRFNGSEEITADTYTYTAQADGLITITPVSGNNYFYSFSVSYPVELKKESFELTFGSEGNYKDAPAVVDLSNIQIGDNGGNNSQVKNGYITIALFAGAKVTINGYPGYTSYKINDGEEITAETYEYVATADETLTITPVSGNNYFYSIKVEYSEGGEAGGETKEEVTYVLDATTDLAAMDAGAKADGDTQVVADFFTIHYSAKTKIDSSKKNFDDGYSATQRINFGAKTNTSNMNNSIEFTVTDAAKVTIWWVSNGDGRQTVIFNANGEVVKTTETSAKNSLYIDSFELEAGTYYIGTADGGSNYTFKVEVETTK